MAGFAPAEQLFVQLWTELFASYSIDSCQVRVSNARTILRELEQITQWVLDGECSADELDALRAEALELVKADPVFAAVLHTERNPLLQSLGRGSTKSSAVRSLQYQCRSALANVAGTYRSAVSDRLREAIAADNRDAVSLLTAAWASDLVSGGMHPSYLSRLGRLFIRPQQNWGFGQRFEWLVSSLAESRTWTCYVPVVNPPVHAEDLGELPLEVVDGQQCTAELTNIRPEAAAYVLLGGRYVVARDVLAPSPEDALDQALLQIEQRLDVVHMCRRGAWSVPARGIVASSQMQFVKQYAVPVSHFEPPAGGGGNVAAVDEAIQKLSSHPRHQERIRNALRFYRLGMAAESSAPRFLNLWIAIETLFRGDDLERGRTGSVLCAVLVRRYGYRLLRNLLEDIRRAELDWEAVGIAGHTSYDRIASLLTTFQDEARSQALVAALGSIPLLGQRAERYAVMFRTGLKAKASLEGHQRRTYWHIRRLNRTRNRIVHSADVASPLALLSGHLQTYCHLALLEITWQLRQGMHDDLDHLLQDIVDGTHMQLELLSAAGGAYDPQLLLNPPLSATA